MSDAKNINEVAQITTVESADYLMVSDISDASLKRATVADVGKNLLGTTDISGCSTDGTVTGGIKAACDGVDNLDSTKLDKSGGTMTGSLVVNQGANAYSSITIGGSGMVEPNSSVLNMWRNSKYASIIPATLTANRSYTLPDATGTIALMNDLATKQDAASGASIGGSSSTSLTLVKNSVYLVLSASNVSRVVSFVLTGETAIQQIESVIASGFSLTYSGLTLTITNNSVYTAPYKIMKLY